MHITFLYMFGYVLKIIFVMMSIFVLFPADEFSTPLSSSQKAGIISGTVILFVVILCFTSVAIAFAVRRRLGKGICSRMVSYRKRIADKKYAHLQQLNTSDDVNCDDSDRLGLSQVGIIFVNLYCLYCSIDW